MQSVRAIAVAVRRPDFGEEGEFAEEAAGPDLLLDLRQEESALDDIEQLAGRIVGGEQGLVGLDLPMPHQRQERAGRKRLPRRAFDLPAEVAQLQEPQRIERQQQDVEDQDRRQPAPHGVDDESDVARHGHQPKRHHRLHVEGREDQDRCDVAEEFTQRHAGSTP